MKTPLLLFVCLVTLIGAGRAEVAKTYHVAPAPRGDDAHDGSIDAPFASLERARLAVRGQLAQPKLRGDIVVELSGGTYELSTLVRFDAADSGREGVRVIYRAAAGDEVILSGGRTVAGWTHERGGVYRTEVGPDVDFRQLWIDGRRAVRARSPNVGLMFQLDADQQADGFDLTSAQLAGVTVRPGEIEMSVLIAWMHKRLRIARVKPEGETSRVVIEAAEWEGVTKQPQGDRVYAKRHYWLENAREFLDAPGEFFLDRPAGVLRYRPRAHEDLAKIVVVRPVLESLIVLDGRPDAPVHDLQFEGLTFVHTGWTRPNRAGFVDVQANSLIPADLAAAVDPHYRHNQRKDRIPAAFQASTADRIVVRGNRFARLGGTGVMFTHGGDDNVIEGNSFYDLAAGGIEFGEDSARPADKRFFPRRNRIANNFIAHIGQDYFGSVPVLGYYTDGSLIEHNEITAVPYTGISQGWGWGNPTGPDDARDNRIRFNRVENYMRRLDDGGGIYTTDRQPGSEIAHNYVARMLPPDAHTKAGGALYLDQFTEGYHVHHNVVAEAIRWLFIWNPNIRHNRVEMNYADTAAQRNDGTDNVVEPVNVEPAGEWSARAREIIAAAGLEPDFARVREIAAPADVIVESTDLDFQIFSGQWMLTETVPDRYGAIIHETSDPAATARWTPILPKAGLYEVRVWQAAGARDARYAIRHAEGEANIDLPAQTSGQGHWVILGKFRFVPGIEGWITLRTGGGKFASPLRADAVRFTHVK